MSVIIYKHTNLVNNISYIGQSRNSTEHRWKSHVSAAKTSNTKFHTAIREFGSSNSVWHHEILYVTNNPSSKFLSYMERFFIACHDTFNNGYNMTKGGETFPPITETTRLNMSISHMGSKNHMYNKPMPDLHKLNISKSKTGITFPNGYKPRTKEHSKNISIALTGRIGISRPMAMEQKDHLSIVKSTGTYHTPWGDFISPKKAERQCPYNISYRSIHTYCRNSSKLISKMAVSKSNMLTDNDIGKSYKKLGFRFTSKS